MSNKSPHLRFWRVLGLPDAPHDLDDGFFRQVILGLWHPTIMMPDNDYTQDELIYILRHETEHYYQHDLWIKTIWRYKNEGGKVYRRLYNYSKEQWITSFPIQSCGW